MFSSKECDPTSKQEAPVSGGAIGAKEPQLEARQAEVPGERQATRGPTKGPGTAPCSPETGAGRGVEGRVYGRMTARPEGSGEGIEAEGLHPGTHLAPQVARTAWGSGEATRSTPPGSGDERVPLGTPEDYYSVAAVLFGESAKEGCTEKRVTEYMIKLQTNFTVNQILRAESSQCVEGNIGFSGSVQYPYYPIWTILAT